MQLSIQVKNAVLVRTGLQNLDAEIPKVGRDQIYKTMIAVKNEMKKEGKPVSYSINWDSQKQRRAFFATNGFGGGIPHKRTGAYTDGWKIEKIENMGYRIVNATRAAIHVSGGAYGNRQSRIQKTRWNLLRDVTDKEIAKLPQAISQEISAVARRNNL